jgi:hypothetical protein
MRTKDVTIRPRSVADSTRMGATIYTAFDIFCTTANSRLDMKLLLENSLKTSVTRLLIGARG